MTLIGRKRDEGFTLIELMIVVAIIGILAAIAIPNFLRFQLRSKAGEGKVNLAAIRTAEEGYFAEYGTYVSCVASPAAWTNGPTAVQKIPWADAGGFGTMGWAPEGDVFYQYQVNDMGGTTPSIEYTAEAQSDIDGNTVNNVWGYVKPAAGATAASAAGALGCPANGTVTGGGGNALETVGPCFAGHGQSIF
jgi:type IV pilus assembly protein PilA